MSSEWAEKDATLQKEFLFKDFKSAFSFAQKVALCAEEMNHHPTLQVEWGRCKVTLTSHDVQGVSERDFILSKKVDSIPTEPT